MNNKNIILNNEEDLKIKIVLPLIKSLGFTEDEIYFEYNFKIRLGQNKPQTIQGRSDILCKINNINLFVIETKSDKKKLVENDSFQAISDHTQFGWSNPLTI